MPKLKLKRTAAEERERALRKARKAAKRAAKTRKRTNDEYPYLFDLPNPNGDVESDGGEYGPTPLPDEPLDYARILAELEERRFQEKLADAMDADRAEGFSRLESVETRLNDYAHVPHRWRTGSMRHEEGSDTYDGARRPEDMEDEEYAEYIRQGMWRRTHKAEFEQAERERGAYEARLARERELKAESKRLAHFEEEERRQRREARGQKKLDEARARYEACWAEILSAHSAMSGNADPTGPTMGFVDVPWPTFLPKGDAPSQLEAIKLDAIELFLFPPSLSTTRSDDQETPTKSRKERLRETMLRFHPDKFEGRVMPLIRESDREFVRDGVGRVVRAVADLLKMESVTN